PFLLSNRYAECAYGGAQVGTPVPVEEFGVGNVMLGHAANERIKLVLMPFAFAGPSNAHCACALAATRLTRQTAARETVSFLILSSLRISLFGLHGSGVRAPPGLASCCQVSPAR